MTYDPTVFVSDTIHEVEKTLIEAFVLVVLVVYLFLGSVRATLIPTFAVPVSLIGTFIALNAVGYSANTVSLLAIVLSIGIVVDDAIVVVENVERVMEEHPELSPAKRPSGLWREITAPIIAIRWCCYRSSCRSPSFRGFPASCFASLLSQSPWHVPFGHQCIDLSPAFAVCCSSPHHGPRRGHRLVMRCIDQVRDGYGAVVAGIVRFR